MVQEMRWSKLSPQEIQFIIEMLANPEEYGANDKFLAIELLEAAREAAEDEAIPEELR